MFGISGRVRPALLAAATLGGVVLLFSAFRPATPREVAVALELRGVLTSLGAAASVCPTQCEITPCDEDEHKNEQAQNGTNSGTVHGCQFSEGGCTDHICNGLASTEGAAPADLRRIETLIRAVSGNDLRSITETRGRLQINHERQTAQLVGCGERIVLSVQLSDEQIAELRLTQ